MKNFRIRLFTSFWIIIFLAAWLFLSINYSQNIIPNSKNISLYLFIGLNAILLLLSVNEYFSIKFFFQEKYIFLKKTYFSFLALLLYFMPFFKYESFFINFNFLSFITFWIILILNLILIAFFCFFSFKQTTVDILNTIIIIFYFSTVYKAFNFFTYTYHIKSLFSSSNNEINGFGWIFIAYLLIISITNDAGAYVGGSLFGKKKIFPKISPNKTWFGVFWGIVLAIISSYLYVWLLQILEFKFLNFIFPNNNLGFYFTFGLFTIFNSILNVFGDLLFSYIKRKNKIKDFSKILPGHGGIIDRIDSLSLITITNFILMSSLLIINNLY